MRRGIAGTVPQSAGRAANHRRLLRRGAWRRNGDLFFGFGAFVQLGAFLGAAAALLAVLAIHRSDSMSPVLTLVLAGVVVSAFCSALVGWRPMLRIPRRNCRISCSGCSAALRPRPGRSSAAVGLHGYRGAVLLGMRWRINVLSLGDEDARTLGVIRRATA